MKCHDEFFLLVVEPTHLQNMNEIGSFPQLGVKMKNVFKPPPCFGMSLILTKMVKCSLSLWRYLPHIGLIYTIVYT